MVNLLNDLTEIGKHFGLPGTAVSYEVIDNGNINFTFKVNYIEDDNEKSYIFQRINTYVFKSPAEIMKNIDLITTYINKKFPDKTTLHFYHTNNGKNYFVADDNFWRVMNYVDSITYNKNDDLDFIRYCGEAFGDFQLQLLDFDVSLLHETIPNFHNTKKRLDTLFEDAVKDEYGRAKEVKAELDYIESVYNFACELSEKYNRGEFPVRVAHNDTKLNNVLFDKETHKPIAIIDLDTVMPGFAPYDFGDAARFICNTSGEDALNLDLVSFDKNKFKALAKGFLSKVRGEWTKEEIECLVQALFSITVEQAARFLDDYIIGDKYYKANYPKLNLIRTRTQLKLAHCIMEQYDELEEIIRNA